MDDYRNKMIQAQSTPHNNPTVRERLEMQKDELERHIAKVKSAIQALDSNPGVAEILEILGRAGF